MVYLRESARRQGCVDNRQRGSAQTFGRARLLQERYCQHVRTGRHRNSQSKGLIRGRHVDICRRSISLPAVAVPVELAADSKQPQSHAVQSYLKIMRILEPTYDVKDVSLKADLEGVLGIEREVVLE